MENKPRLVRVGGASHPLSLYLPSRTYKVVVYTPAERADTLPLFLLYPYMYSVVEALRGYKGTLHTFIV
jgi:hypothetical protein